MSTQLDDFKRALGLDDNFQETVAPAPTSANENNEPVTPKKEKADLLRRTVSIPGSLHTRISLLGLWMNREGIMDNPKLYEVIAAAIDEYINQHPGAAGYVDKVWEKAYETFRAYKADRQRDSPSQTQKMR